MPAGSRLRDRVALFEPQSGTTREIVDLAGNLAEWARDTFNLEGDAFWSAAGVFVDPVAERASSIAPERTGRFVNAVKVTTVLK